MASAVCIRGEEVEVERLTLPNTRDTTDNFSADSCTKSFPASAL